MPSDANSRAVSACVGFVMFLAVCTVGYINATYEGYLGSFIISAIAVVLSLTMWVKLAVACGFSNSWVDLVDRISTVVSILALAAFAYRFLFFFQRQGAPGFMSIIALCGLVGSIVFGVADIVTSWFGDKYARVSDAVDAANKALHQG